MDLPLPPGADDPRFARGAIESAIRWAVGVLRSGDDKELAGAARPSDLADVREAVGRFDLAAVATARVVSFDPNGDPPTVVAELEPVDARIVLRAVEWPEPQWKILALIGRDDLVPAGLPERYQRVPISPATLRRPELDWLTSALTEVASMLGADIAPPAPPPQTEDTSEDLGMGETRRVERRAWTSGGVEVVVEHARHEIYDGATPAWDSVWGSVSGLPGGAAIIMSAPLWVEGESFARLFVTAPRQILEALRPPSL